MFKFKKYAIGMTGLIPSPPDSRDIALSSVSPTIKRYPEAFPPPFDLTISNQKNKPHCVGFSCATIKQAQEFREQENVVFNGDEIYAECKKIDGIPNFNGTYLRVGLKVLQKVGANSGGKNYKIASYARVDDNSFEGLKKAITLHGELLAGFTGSNQGWAREIIRPPKTGETTWNHAVALIGYEKNYLIGQNSWSKNAHKNGLFKVPSNYLPFEAWTSLDKPNTHAEPIKTGWVASEFLTLSGGQLKVNAKVGLRVRTTPKILPNNTIKILPFGTVIQLTNNEPVKDIQYNWVEVIV